MHTLCIVYLATIENGSIFLAFLVLLGFNVLFAIIAAFLVFAVVNTSLTLIFTNYPFVLHHTYHSYVM